MMFREGSASIEIDARCMGQVQAGMLTSAGVSSGTGLVFAAALIESETTQAAPAKAVQMALPAQLK